VCHLPPRADHEAGFALFPLILAVVVIGALIGVGLNLVKERVRRTQFQECRSRVVSAVRFYLKSAITSYKGSMMDRAISPKTPPRKAMDRGSMTFIRAWTLFFTSPS